MKQIYFHTLLFVDHKNKSLSLNGISGSFEQQILTYIRCCESLALSLNHFTSVQLNVITNDKAYINERSETLKTTQITFEIEIPKDIAFYAAHHKIEVLKYLSELNDSNSYHFLIDNDVLCINKIPKNLLNCISNTIPVYYDLTDLHYPAYGRDAMINAKEKVGPNNFSSTGLWAGGELIGGDSNFYKNLHREITTIWSNYLKTYKTLHHQGDEVVVSIALEILIQKGVYICNVGSFGGIGRYWSVKTRHIQKDWKAYTNHFLVHLPADKKYLATLKTIDDNIIQKLSKYIGRKKLREMPIQMIKRALNIIKLNA